MPAAAAWLARFSQELAAGLELEKSFPSAKGYFNLQREQLLNKRC